MAKSETFTFICDKCQIETELPKFLVKTMQHCPFCGARHNPPIDEVQKILTSSGALKLRKEPALGTHS